MYIIVYSYYIISYIYILIIITRDGDGKIDFYITI